LSYKPAKTFAFKSFFIVFLSKSQISLKTLTRWGFYHMEDKLIEHVEMEEIEDMLSDLSEDSHSSHSIERFK
jgi:hypothetical protein